MNYEFTLDKKAAVSLIAGSIIFAILLFAAGWVAAVQWAPANSPLRASGTAQKEEAELPKEPLLNDEALAPKSAAPKSNHPAVDQPQIEQQPLGQPQAGQPNKTAAAAPPQPAAVSVSAKAPPTGGEVKIIQEAAADPANAASTDAEPDYVTVQVGVYLDEQEANRLFKQVERKGYAPSFFSGRDAQARQWYAVRIGSYSDKQQAANAAANFTRQEKIQAVVRPAGSL